MKCEYRRCDKEVIQNPKSKKPKKFCCEKHGTAEREIIRWEKLRKPRIKRRCRYRLCGKIFETGNYSKLYCCTKHQNAEKQLRSLEAKSKDDFKIVRISAKQKQKAREFASLNCLKYRECNNGIIMNCHKCQNKEIVKGAWRHEPGALYHTQSDYHSVCLPSTGRSQ